VILALRAAPPRKGGPFGLASCDRVRGSVRSTAIPDPAIGIIVGLLLGAAVMSKASSGILVVIPLAAAAAVLIPPRRWPTIVAATVVVGTATCLPWLLRNLAWTGNPVFPFATGLFGQGDWTDEQVRRFAAGHSSDPSILSNLTALLREFLLDDLIGGFIGDCGGSGIIVQYWINHGAGIAVRIPHDVREGVCHLIIKSGDVRVDD